VPDDPLTIAIVVASTREGRVGSGVARWFARQCRRMDDVEVDLIEVAELGLPGALSPGRDPAVEPWAARIACADAVVVVTPEYNHGYPASLKHAVDLLHAEWHAKPVGFVSYGGVSGGLRAVEQLRQVFAELHTVTIRNTVSFAEVWGQLDAAGEPRDAPACTGAAAALLAQLTWWATALRAARAARPYAA
jgi:NAD(P)H-dependent FMN reductase